MGLQHPPASHRHNKTGHVGVASKQQHPEHHPLTAPQRSPGGCLQQLTSVLAHSDVQSPQLRASRISLPGARRWILAGKARPLKHLDPIWLDPFTQVTFKLFKAQAALGPGLGGQVV